VLNVADCRRLLTHACEDEMAKRRRLTRLSTGEFKLMTVLWEHGPLTLAEAHRLQPGNLGYTTIQTQLNRLVTKGAASRTKVRPMRYRALIAPGEAGETLLRLLIDTVGGGSVVPLVAQLISLAPLTREEGRSVKQLVDDATVKKIVKRPPASRRRKKL
jgi:BlaI family transcriptional regulator, penicillinase repressor